jgi:hypothetical protein
MRSNEFQSKDQHVQHLTRHFQSAQCVSRRKCVRVAWIHLFPPDCGVQLPARPWVASDLDTDAGIPSIAFPSQKSNSKCVATYSALVNGVISFRHCHYFAAESNKGHKQTQHELRHVCYEGSATRTCKYKSELKVWNALNSEMVASRTIVPIYFLLLSTSSTTS